MSASSYETLSTPENWGGVTDPAFHDASNFRYLVHAFKPDAKMAVATQQLMAGDREIYDEGWGDQSIDLYDEPTKLSERVTLSMSLVDQSHKGTWGHGGLIVGVAQENIIATSPTDNGTDNNNLGQLLTRASQQSKLDADSLLAQTSPTQHNEVVAVCKQGEYPLELKGFFIKTSPSGEPLNRQLTDRMHAHARRLGLPLIQIVSEGFYATNRVEIHKDGWLAIEFNGSRYLFEFNGREDKFIVFDEMRRPFFPSPTEIEAAVAFGVSDGSLDPDLATQLLEKYTAFDRQRQTPTADFDDDGSVGRVSYKTGYGKNEDEIQIRTGGYSSRTNLGELMEALDCIELGSNILQRSSFKTGTISPDNADEMVSSACKQLDEASAQRVRDWYSSCRSNVEQQWSFHQQSQRRLGGCGLSLSI